VTAKRARRPFKALAAAVLAVAALALASVAGLFLFVENAMGPVDPGDGATVAVTVPEGAGTRSIGALLESEGLISSAFVFSLKTRQGGYDGRYRAGLHELSKSMSMHEIMEALAGGGGGGGEPNMFTVPEGLTVAQTADRLAAGGFVDRDAFMLEASEGDFSSFRFLESPPAAGEPLEGYLYPETYDMRQGALPRDFIERMLSQFDKLFTEECYRRAEEMGLTVNEAVTIASLIERETKVAGERPLVSSVIHNRIKKGMRLQIDATVQYALGEQKPRLLYSDLEVDSPYNTYKIDGLPPGPICSPRFECIEAALRPADTDYLYYVLKPSLNGEHNFSSSYGEFERHKAEYLEAVGAP
jgi:UPF0755 protein